MFLSRINLFWNECLLSDIHPNKIEFDLNKNEFDYVY